MFISIHHDIPFLRQTVSPLVLDILDDARREFVPPTGIDDKRPADTGIDESALVSQSRFLKELARCSVCMGFSVLETASYGLPEIKRLAATEQQYVASVAVNDDQNRNGATVFRGALLFGARRPQPDAGFFELLCRDFARRIGQRAMC